LPMIFKYASIIEASLNLLAYSHFLQANLLNPRCL